MSKYTLVVTDTGNNIGDLSVESLSLGVLQGSGPKGAGWTGVSYATGTGRFTFTSNDGLGYISDDIRVGLDADLLDGQHGSYYTSYTDTAIANLIDTAPATLDTLNELAAALGDDPNFATTVTNNIATKVSKAGDTMTGNLSFGDNNKAIFGAGSDLQIYHDGSNSYIDDAGTGVLNIRAESYIALSDMSNKVYMTGTSGGAVGLRFNDAQKLATTSTGVDVTGTVTADGLTVDGDGTLQSGTGAILKIRSTDTDVTTSDLAGAIYFETDDATRTQKTRNAITSELLGAAANTRMKFKSSQDDGALTTRMDIDSNGDISFYEDTGTTAKLFWDASAEALGIGTSSPSAPLSVRTSSGYLSQDIIGDATYGAVSLRFRNAGNTATTVFHNYDSGEYKFGTIGSEPVVINTVNAERMRIDSSGRVGIGTSSPGAPLDVAGGSLVTGNWNVTAKFQDATASKGLYLGYNGSNSNAIVAAVQAGAGIEYWTYSGGWGERMRIDSSGRVGIGTSSPNAPLSIGNNSSGSNADIELGSTARGEIRWTKSGGGINDYLGYVGFRQDSNYMYFGTNGTERMRIDASGNLLVGGTGTAPDTSSTDTGHAFRADGRAGISRDGGPALSINRLTSDGAIQEFRKNGTTVGSIGSVSGTTYVTGAASGLVFNSGRVGACNTSGAIVDNTTDLGNTNNRFQDIYATNALIQTSDRNEKQDIAELDEAERRVAVAAKGLLRKFRWKDAVAEKGDAARIHFGIIAQDLQAAFAAEGLDAGRYAMFISSTWWEKERVIPAVEAQEAVYDEEGNLVSEAVEAQPEKTVVDHFETAEEAPEGATERTRLGVRYPELLAFIIAAI